MLSSFRFILLPLCFLGAWAGSYQEMAGVRFPEKIEVGGKSLVLNGLGLRKKTIFRVNVYVAALYVPRKSRDEREIMDSSELRRLDVVFLRDVKQKDIVKSWVEGFAKNCKISCDRLKVRLDHLNTLMTDVKRGQLVSFVFYPDRMTIETPGKNVESISGQDFSQVVLGTFIGVPPTEAVKKGLLGG